MTRYLRTDSDEIPKNSDERGRDSDGRGRDSDESPRDSVESPRDSNERGMLVNPNIFIDPHHQTPSTPTIPCPTRPSDLRKRPSDLRKRPSDLRKRPGAVFVGAFLGLRKAHNIYRFEVLGKPYLLSNHSKIDLNSYHQFRANKLLYHTL